MSLKFKMMFVLCLVVTVAFSQDYYVLQVKGVVKNRSGKSIQANDVLKSDDRLQFTSPEDAVAVVHPKNGRFVIKPATATGSGELIAIVKEAITPGIKRLSTRSGAIINVIDAQVFFQDPLVLLDTIRVKVSQTAFPMNNEAFFFIRYMYNGEAINKKLSFSDDVLLISREQLYSVDGKRISETAVSGLKLFYMSAGSARELTPVRFVTPDIQSLRNELLTLSRRLTTGNAEEEAYLYTTEFYGKIAASDFAAWYVREVNK